MAGWARSAGLEPDAVVRFLERSVAMLPPELMPVSRLGLSNGRYALVVGNYFLAYLTGRQFGMAAFDGLAVPSELTTYVYASAAGALILPTYPTGMIAAVTSDGRYWRSYTGACALLFASRQGRSPHYMTSRVRPLLSDALLERPGQPAAEASPGRRRGGSAGEP
ncbi:MAG: hypothetical protein ACM3S1_11175 [Hyphomicrobiales bacterium]